MIISQKQAANVFLSDMKYKLPVGSLNNSWLEFPVHKIYMFRCDRWRQSIDIFIVYGSDGRLKTMPNRFSVSPPTLTEYKWTQLTKPATSSGYKPQIRAYKEVLCQVWRHITVSHHCVKGRYTGRNFKGSQKKLGSKKLSGPFCLC